MEADPSFAPAIMDAINGLNEMERHAMRAAIVADTRMHGILPLYDMMYTDIVGELWCFDEDGNLIYSLESRRGVRQGCVVGLFIVCATMAPTYATLKAKLGPEGMLVAFSDDVYLYGPPPSVASTISKSPTLHKEK
jgi:hypothetical protein